MLDALFQTSSPYKNGLIQREILPHVLGRLVKTSSFKKRVVIYIEVSGQNNK